MLRIRRVPPILDDLFRRRYTDTLMITKPYGSVRREKNHHGFISEELEPLRVA
jgi:hypothetical protein